MTGFLVVCAACSGGTDDADEPDGGAQLACRAFYDLADDYSDGVVAPSELRDRIKGIEDDASVSEEPGVAQAARAMLVAATSGGEAEISAGVLQMDAACSAAVS